RCRFGPPATLYAGKHGLHGVLARFLLAYRPAVSCAVGNLKIYRRGDRLADWTSGVSLWVGGAGNYSAPLSGGSGIAHGLGRGCKGAYSSASESGRSCPCHLGLFAALKKARRGCPRQARA